MLSKAFNIIDKVLGFVEDWSLFLATMAALIALFFNVILRYGFNYSLAWSEELVREVLILTTLIGCSAAIKARNYVKIDALVQLVGGLKTPLTFFSSFVTLIFAGMMIFYGWKMTVLQAATDQATIIMEIPLEYIYVILPIMGVMMFLRTLQMIYLDIRVLGDKKQNA
jgi:C4-dicarboxylate transporter DctQ subunit